MGRPGLLIRLVGLALLLIGIVYPWVVFDPPQLRAENIARMESVLTEERIPQVIRDWLAVQGFTVDLSSEQMWSLLGREEIDAHYDYVSERDRLFAWDYLRIEATGMTRAVIVSVLLAASITIIALLVNTAQGKGASFHISFDATPLRWIQGGFYAITVALMLIYAPVLDSFGVSGEWNMSWLDVLTGAEATIAPRLLIPAGLLLLLIGVVLDATEGASSAVDDLDFLDYDDAQSLPRF